MKGYSLTLKSALINGLRPDKVSGKGGTSLVQCVNARCTPKGLEGYAPKITGFPAFTVGGVAYDARVNWPFGQLFLTDSGIYLGDATNVYLLSYAAGAWTGTALSNFAHGINYPWTCANVPLFPVFASGDLLIYYDNTAGAWARWNKTYAAELGYGDKWLAAWDQPMSVCFNNGQVVTAGSKYSMTAPSDCRKIRWSEIGAFNFLGATASSLKNTAGFAYASDDDKEILMRVMPLGKNFIVYGSLGVYALVPAKTNQLTSIPATFGVERLPITGINNPLAVGGDKDGHLLIDRHGYLWAVGPDMTPSKLGYQEFFKPMVDDTVLSSHTSIVSIVHNKAAGEFYISNGSDGYIFNGKLTATDKMITSILDLNNEASSSPKGLESSVYGYFVENGAHDFMCVTDAIDFKLGAIKTVEQISLIGDTGRNDTEVALDWRMDRESDFRRTDWKRTGPGGVTSITAAGVEIRVCVRCKRPSKVRLEAITIGWKLTDKRQVRGTYANEVTA